MDNNNPAQQTPSVPVPPVIPEVPISDQPSGESNKMIIWLVVGIVIIIAIVGGIYFFLSSQQAAKNTQEVTKNPVVETSPKPPDTVDALDRDLSAINVDDTEVDFVSIDSDLQQL